MTGDRLTTHYSKRAARTAGAAGRRRKPGRPRVPCALEALVGHRMEVRECRKASEPMPIWFAALAATPCQANAGGQERAVRWECVAGRALYTNVGTDTEVIQPLDVRLMAGYTLAVYWSPGETAYSMETYRQTNLCVA